jgi:hypothetical protein
MKIVSTEKFIEKLSIEVYPITIIKFLLNRRRILSYFNRASNKNFELRGTKYLLDNSNCEQCMLKKDQNILCRQHTSISRVMNGDNVGYDTDTGSYFFKNEIFKMMGDKLVIIYCPHPKLIKIIGEELTDSNIRKVNPITIEDPNLKIKEYSKIVNFSSNDLLETNMKCWFNDLFSIITIPEDRNFSNWCLVPNQSTNT